MSSFYKSVPKIMIIWCTVPEIWHMTDAIAIFHFGCIFALYPPPPPPPNSPKNGNFKKMKNKMLEISSFYTCVPKITIRLCTVPEIWCTMYRQTEKVTHRGRYPTQKQSNIVSVPVLATYQPYQQLYIFKNEPLLRTGKMLIRYSKKMLVNSSQR